MMIWSLDKRVCGDWLKSVILFAVASLGMFLFKGEKETVWVLTV